MREVNLLRALSSKSVRLVGPSRQPGGLRHRGLLPALTRPFGRPTADSLVATAHKIARIVYFMLKEHQPYQDGGAEAYNTHFQTHEVKVLERKAAKLASRSRPKRPELRLGTPHYLFDRPAVG